MAVVHDHLGFRLSSDAIKQHVLVPRYYNPEIEMRLRELSETHDLLPLGELMDAGEILTRAGKEIGKMSYGTGNIPFVRTSDISNWEIKTDPKQGVSDEIFHELEPAQDVRAGDLFLVRDGTYLVGNACKVTDADLPLLYQSHILRLRCMPDARIDADLLLAIFASPILRRQVRAKQFTADIIDTLGDRVRELVLPIPKSKPLRRAISRRTSALVAERHLLRSTIHRLPLLAQAIIKCASVYLRGRLESKSERWRMARGRSPSFVHPTSRTGS